MSEAHIHPPAPEQGQDLSRVRQHPLYQDGINLLATEVFDAEGTRSIAWVADMIDEQSMKDEASLNIGVQFRDDIEAIGFKDNAREEIDAKAAKRVSRWLEDSDDEGLVDLALRYRRDADVTTILKRYFENPTSAGDLKDMLGNAVALRMLMNNKRVTENKDLERQLKDALSHPIGIPAAPPQTLSVAESAEHASAPVDDRPSILASLPRETVTQAANVRESGLDEKTMNQVRNSSLYKDQLAGLLEECFFGNSNVESILNQIADSGSEQLEEVVDVIEHDLKVLNFKELRAAAYAHAEKKIAEWKKAGPAKLRNLAESNAKLAEPVEILFAQLTQKKKKTQLQLSGELGLSLALNKLVDHVRTLGDERLQNSVEGYLPRYAQRSVIVAASPEAASSAASTFGDEPIEFEKEFTPEEIKVMPEYGEYLKVAFEEAIISGRENDADELQKCIDDLLQRGSEEFKKAAKGSKRAQERNAAAKYVASLLATESGRATIVADHLDHRIEVERNQLLTETNFGEFVKKVQPYVTAYLDQKPEEEKTYQDDVNEAVLISLRNELQKDPTSRKAKAVESALTASEVQQAVNTSRSELVQEIETITPAPLSDEAVAALRMKLTGEAAPVEQSSGVKFHRANGEVVTADVAKYETSVVSRAPRPERVAPSRIERGPVNNELRESLKPRDVHAEEIPSTGGKGTMMVDVYIDENGRIYSEIDTLLKPIFRKEGDKTVADYRRTKISYDFKGQRTLIRQPGLYTLQVRVTDRIASKDGIPEILQVELAYDTYKFGDIVRPIAFNQQKLTYLLPNNQEFTLTQQELRLIDERGYLLEGTEEGELKFPLVELRGQSETRAFADYYGAIVTADALRLRKNLEVALAKYRLSSKEKPLDIVVSSRTTSLKRGLEDFRADLMKAKSNENQELVTELERMGGVAYQKLEQFERQKTVGENFWEDYIKFFDRVQQDDVKELLKTSDVRRFYFPSDLDGEMSLNMFIRAGIPTRVLLFPPDQTRTGGVYRPGAVHLDISHGSGEDYRLPNREGASVEELAEEAVIFLDEDDEKTFSAAQTTYEHLLKLNLISATRKDDRAFRYMLQFTADHDSYTGLYESQEDCKRILASMDRNIYGFVSQLTDLGRFDVVTEFFMTVVPEIENELLKNNEELRGPKNISALRTAVMRELVDHDIRKFLAARVPELFGGHRDIKNEQHDLLLETRRRFDELVANGFVGETRFGKTLFDPGDAMSYFDPIERRKKSLASIFAFARGFDCYVSYREWQNSCVINVAPFARKAEQHVKIPDNLFLDETTGATVGQVIKGGRYFVMNASSAKLKNFGQIVDAFLTEGDTTYEIPPGVAEYVAAEQKGRDVARGVIRRIHPGMLEAQDAARGRRPAPRVDAKKEALIPSEIEKKQEVPLPSEIYKLAETLQQGINLIAADPDVRIRDGRPVRERIVNAYQELLQSRTNADPAIKARIDSMTQNAREMMLFEADVTWKQIANTLVAPGMRERVRTFKREQFEEQYFAVMLVRLGFNAYRSVFTETERRRLRGQWSQNLAEVWKTATAQ